MQSAQSLRLFADAGQQSAFDPDRFTGSPIFQLSARRTIIQSVDRNQGGFAVPKFVERAVLLGIVLAVPHAAWGADSEFPVLNSIGRFWGVGYTRGGYHAAQDGRFDIVTNRHPAPNYRPGSLPHYSQPIYSPPPASPSPVVAPTPTVQKSGDKSSAPKKSEAKPGAPEANELPRPVVPAKPAGPPPRWLEDYLQREAAEKAPGEIPHSNDNGQPQDDAPESSPSDLLFELPAEGAQSAIVPRKNVDFSILDASYPINGHRARAAQEPVQTSVQSLAVPPVNRYRYR